MAFKRSAVRSRLSPPSTDRKANALRFCYIKSGYIPSPKKQVNLQFTCFFCLMRFFLIRICALHQHN